MPKRLLFPIILLMIGLNLQAQKSKGRIERLDARAFQVKTIHLKAKILDLRSTSEIEASGMIRGAQALEWDTDAFYAEAAKFPVHQPVMLYCASGYRSEAAAEYLLKKGFLNMIVLQYGFDEWDKEGLEKVDLQGKLLRPDAYKRTPDSQQTGE